MAIRLTDIKSTGASYAELDDKMLVLDFQAGQPAAFVEIHRRYGPLARHVCRRFLPNAHDAEEAFQETMIRVFQGLFRFNGQFALQPWIARIATNVSLDQLRSRARRPQVDDDALEDHDREDHADTPDLLVERLFERDLVLAVLADLPESHRRALVLRELEGRSHKEIAEAMGITSSQAKALIHRAKGSFRRSWLVKVTERGGVAAIAFLPLLWVLKAAGAVKRVGDKVANVGQVAQVTAPELVATSASVGAPVATGIAERAVAAGVTLLLAGGVTYGAVTVTRDKAPEPPQPRVVAVAPAASEREEPAADVELAPSVTEEPREEKDDRGRHDQPVVVDEPVIEPSPSPSTEEPVPAEPTPSPSPEPEEPSPSPSPDPAEPLGPAPSWQFNFATAAATEERCGCSGSQLVRSSVTGTLPDEVAFTQSIDGVALDASGAAAWSLTLDLEGSVTASGGQLEARFLLGAGGAMSTYAGTAVLQSREATNGGGPVLYRFSGSYELRGEHVDGRPVGGAMIVNVGFWPDETAITASVSLS